MAGREVVRRWRSSRSSRTARAKTAGAPRYNMEADRGLGRELQGQADCQRGIDLVKKEAAAAPVEDKS
jgi:hypothetical protein